MNTAATPKFSWSPQLRHLPATRNAQIGLLCIVSALSVAGESAHDSHVAAARLAEAKNRAHTGNEATLFQVSTLDALLSGLYEASFTVGELKRRGDFGLGTYEGLDGEMIVLDGHYYHMRSNGVLSESVDGDRAPFAAVTTFRSDVQFTIKQASLAQLSDMIDTVLPSKNLFYAIRIHGTFTAISTRAIPLQFFPYSPLSQLVPTQNVFNYTNITGTAVDIRSPAFVSGINQVGHHYHFVSDDVKAGGHALSFTTGEVTVDIQLIRQHDIWLPTDEPFLNATLPFVSTSQ